MTSPPDPLSIVRAANIVRHLAHWQRGLPHVPLYCANGWLGGSWDAFGFQSRPQHGMDHGRTHVGYANHYDRQPNGGHDVRALCAIQARRGGEAPGLAGLTEYRQELDLGHGVLTTRFAWGSRYETRVFASRALPQLLELRLRQELADPADALSIHLPFELSAADNNDRRPVEGMTALFAPCALEAFEESPGIWRVSARTNCRETVVRVAAPGGALRWTGDGFDCDRGSETTLRLLVDDDHLPADIAADPAGVLLCADDRLFEAHCAAMEAWWDVCGLLELPTSRERNIWVRSAYYLQASLAPFPAHVQVTTGLNANIWAHGFAQDMYYVVENLPRLGLFDLARAQFPVWLDNLDAVLRYTRRLCGRGGAFFPWIPPFEDWDGFETDGPTNPDSYEFHNSAYVLNMFWSFFLRTGDLDALREHLPLIREVARFYVDLSVPHPEGPARLEHPDMRSQDEAMTPGERSDTPLCAVWSALYSFRAYGEACRRLEVEDDADLRSRVAALLERGYDFASLERSDGGLKTTANDTRPRGRQKHPVQLNPIAFLPMADFMDGYPPVRTSWERRMDLTKEAREPRSYGWTFGEFTLASARMRSGRDVAADLDLIHPARFMDAEEIQFYESSCVHGWQHKKPYYFTTHGLYLQALTDCVLQDCRGVVDLFAALPQAWEEETVRFHRLRTLEGLRADGEWNAGRFTVSLTATRDADVRVRVSRPELLVCVDNGDVFPGGAERTLRFRAGQVKVLTGEPSPEPDRIATCCEVAESRLKPHCG